LKNNVNKARNKEHDVMRMTAGSSLSSLYELPIDRPLGLDISKFLTTNSDMKYEGNDIELI
jgi:hypothetical protein